MNGIKTYLISNLENRWSSLLAYLERKVRLPGPVVRAERRQAVGCGFESLAIDKERDCGSWTVAAVNANLRTDEILSSDRNIETSLPPVEP